MTDPPKYTTYSSLVSFRGLRIVNFIGELNGMSRKTGDIGNAYLEEFTTEKVYTIACCEFDCIGLQGCVLVIVKALYGLKTSGSRFPDLFVEVMEDLV